MSEKTFKFSFYYKRYSCANKNPYCGVPYWYSKGQFPLTFNLTQTSDFVKYRIEIPEKWKKTLNTSPSYFIRLNRREISLSEIEKFLNRLRVCTRLTVAVLTPCLCSSHCGGSEQFSDCTCSSPVSSPHNSHSSVPGKHMAAKSSLLLRWHASVHLLYFIYVVHYMWHLRIDWEMWLRLTLLSKYSTSVMRIRKGLKSSKGKSVCLCLPQQCEGHFGKVRMCLLSHQPVGTGGC